MIIRNTQAISVYCNDHTEHTNTHMHALCGQKAERLCFSDGRKDTAIAGFILLVYRYTVC
jgi:hypothetical protein